MNVGFIGLGLMGGSMALNLQAAGHSLCVHDLRRESAAPHLAKGAVWKDSPRALAEASRLGMGWLAGEKASHAEVRDLFAGLGDVEIAEPVVLGSSRTSPGDEALSSDKNFVETSRLVRAKPPIVNRSIAWER